MVRATSRLNLNEFSCHRLSMNQKTLCKLAWRIACAVVVQISAVTNSVSALAQEVRTSPTTLPSDLVLTLGKSKIVEVPFIVEKVSVGNPAVADIVVTGPRQVYLLGKAIGSSNLMLWRKGGEVVVIDLSVELDLEQLRLQFSAILPGERALRVHSAADAVVLSGPVSSISRADQAVALADRFVQSFTRSNPGHARVLNLLNVAPAQQVMLEVKVAEVSRAMLDQFGAASI